uniref:RRM domain-containing protein n=1 Tax=Romanomermis culicivorax TaxID=13658 RepID=A0A915KD13_ROMCU
MSIIIRLQHLPWSADAADVREFFRGLIIPEGGVHIVGGRDGDVFVQFSSDEDARLAMKNDGKRLKDSKIKLLLSSQKEMQKVIEKARSDYAAGLVTPNFDSRAAAASDDEEESGDKKRAVGRRSRSRSGSKERRHRLHKAFYCIICHCQKFPFGDRQVFISLVRLRQIFKSFFARFSHHVQRNAPNANTAPQAIHQATNFQAQQAAVPGVMAQFAAPLQYQAPLQP